MMKKFLTIIILLTGVTTFAQKAETPTETIDRIFKEYVNNYQSTDTDINKNLMKTAFTAEQDFDKNKDLELLINVWMYYNPTDFPTRELIEPIFIKNKAAALKALEKRIKNKKKWENETTPPYSDLILFKEKFSK